MIIIAAFLALIAVVFVYFYPRYGAYLMWSFVWMYPIGILQGILPLAVRFDDLWVVWVFICSIFSPNRSYVLRDKKMIYIALLWFTAFLLGNLVGLLTGGGSAWREIIKMIGKAAYVPMFAVILKNTIHSKEDVICHLKAIFIAIIGAAIIGILQTYAPLLVTAWEIPTYRYEIHRLESAEVGELERRGGGSMGVTYLAVTCMALTIVALRICINKNRIGLRIFAVFSAFITGIGVIITQTRSAIGAVVLGIMYSLVAHRKKIRLFIVFSFVALILLSRSDLFLRLTSRFAMVETGKQGRITIWKDYLTKPVISYLFFGRGMTAESIRIDMSAHNTYIGAIAYMGLFGATVTTYLIYILWRTGKRLQKVTTDTFAVSIGEGITAMIVGTLFIGMFGEYFQNAHMRILVAMGVLGMAYYELLMQEEMLYEEYHEECSEKDCLPYEDGYQGIQQ